MVILLCIWRLACCKMQNVYKVLSHLWELPPLSGWQLQICASNRPMSCTVTTHWLDPWKTSDLWPVINSTENKVYVRDMTENVKQKIFLSSLIAHCSVVYKLMEQIYLWMAPSDLVFYLYCLIITIQYFSYLC